MSGPRSVRMILVAIIALGTVGMTGDLASGARAPIGEPADRPASRSAVGDGQGDAWAKAHRRYVERARRSDADVVFLGDSITHAWGDEDRDDLGHESWRALFAPLRSVNFGFPGDQTQHLLRRVEDGELDGHPRVAVVLIGTNNLGDGHSAEETASGIAAVVDAIRRSSSSTRVLVVGILPRRSGPGDLPGPESARVNAIVGGWAVGAEVEFLDAGASFLRPDGRLDYALTRDGIHPSAKGYAILARALREPVRRLLRGG